MPVYPEFVAAIWGWSAASIVAGAAGGFVSWIYSITVGVPFALPGALAIITCCILGAAAALISVYMVANSEVSNIPRLIAFSVLGLSPGNQAITIDDQGGDKVKFTVHATDIFQKIDVVLTCSVVQRFQ